MGTIQWIWNWEDQLKEMMPMGMRVMPRSMGGRRYSGFGSLAWLGEEADFSLRYQSRKAPQRRTKRIMPIPGSSQLLSQLSC